MREGPTATGTAADHAYPTPALDPSAPDAARFPKKCKPKSADDPGPWEAMAAEDRLAINRIMANQGKAVAAYESALISRNAPFDLYVAGDEGAMSDAQKRGLKLFVGKAACVDCHRSAHFSDGEFHNIGVPQLGPNLPAEDDGRFSDIGRLKKHAFNSKSVFRDGPDPELWSSDIEAVDADKGAFRTPSLRNVVETAPYGHTGHFDSLRDVIDFYDRGGDEDGFVGDKSPVLVPLSLSTREKDDLLAFLESLTGEPISDELKADPHE